MCSAPSVTSIKHHWHVPFVIGKSCFSWNENFWLWFHDARSTLLPAAVVVKPNTHIASQLLRAVLLLIPIRFSLKCYAISVRRRVCACARARVRSILRYCSAAWSTAVRCCEKCYSIFTHPMVHARFNGVYLFRFFSSSLLSAIVDVIVIIIIIFLPFFHPKPEIFIAMLLILPMHSSLVFCVCVRLQFLVASIFRLSQPTHQLSCISIGSKGRTSFEVLFIYRNECSLYLKQWWFIILMKNEIDADFSLFSIHKINNEHSTNGATKK